MRDRFECSRASRERDEPLTATASRVLGWLLIEVRGAWGRDALVESDLGLHVDRAWRTRLTDLGVRVIAIRRDLELDGRTDVTLAVAVAGRPGRRVAQAWSRKVPDLAAVMEATADLTAGRGRSDQPSEWQDDPGPYVLVCTNGRHDSCCATYGRPLVRALRASRWADRVWECSHVGGDRFAGNLVVLPDGLYFGRCGAEDAERILTAYDQGRLDLPNYRGRSGLRIAEQAAEHFVRRERGLDRLDAIVAIARVDPRTTRVTAREGEGTLVFDVTLERTEVPAPTPLTCTGTEGQEYPAFRLVAMTEI